MTAQRIFAVGDISCASLLKIGIMPQLSIVDFYVQRKKAFQNLSQLGFASANPDAIIKNEHGQISKELIEFIDKSAKSERKAILVVDGEEDLAAIPAMLLCPLGTQVIYGQPNKGSVQVTVETETKDSLCKLLGLT